LSPDKKSIVKYAYKTGQEVEVLFHVDNARETKLEAIEGYLINSEGTRILVWNEKEYVYRRSYRAMYYDYDVRRNFLKPLSDTPGKVMHPVLSPDGRLCAFVRDNNIWVKKFDYDTEIQITKDGSPGAILNGLTDWVYEEEFTVTNLMSWSVDNLFLAYLKSDETEVPTFSFQQFDGSLYPPVYSYKYPKAGENNSRVACYAYNVETKDTKKMQVPLDEDGYIPMIRFTENVDQLAVMTLNRHQNSFRMFMANPRSTLAKQVLHETNPYYINPTWIQGIRFSKDHFVYVSEESGFAHINLYSITGMLQKKMTSGNWDVTALYGFNPVTKTVYYQAAEESPLKREIYKVDQKGTKTKLSKESGTNKATFSRGCQYFVNNFSNATTPNRLAILDEKGKELVLLEDNAALKSSLANLNIPQKEFLTIPNATGQALNAWILKPTDFNPAKAYPLLIVQYSGPDSQEVKDEFKVDWYHALCKRGYVVAAVDPRGTGARGQEFRKCTYQQLGILESDDLVAAAKHLGSQSYIDPNRMAIWGWSFGGTTTLMSMSRGGGVFKAGIAIAPVTDWKFYDSVYTERFMRTPKENFSNYEFCSPVKLAGQLQGNLLLVHGTADDNVHLQNTLYYSEALVEAGKQFDMQIYSNKNHSILGENTRTHLYTRVIDFLDKNL
ncbi:DPP IV N-terminal domain-containing protein, partial [Bacteroidales bacterium OttesenSCG-928-L03]|nr:DPP IV N-terminal domain-containing protein [Bacteroidales bacterium OttesenSCG-928-L03]